LPGDPSDFLIVVAFVSEENIDTLGVAFDQRRRNLAIVFSCRRHVLSEDSVHFRIDQQRHFELLNRESNTLRVVFRSVTAVKP